MGGIDLRFGAMGRMALGEQHAAVRSSGSVRFRWLAGVPSRLPKPSQASFRITQVRRPSGMGTGWTVILGHEWPYAFPAASALNEAAGKPAPC
jgi:hypothetical protein